MQQVPHLPSHQILELGSEFLPAALSPPTSVAPQAPGTAPPPPRRCPARGPDPKLWHRPGQWGPGRSLEMECHSAMKAPVQARTQGVWAAARSAVQGQCPPQALLLWPVLPLAVPSNLPHSCLRSARGRLMPWSGSPASQYTSSLPCTPRPRAEQPGSPRMEGPRCFPLPGLTLLRASALVLLPVLDVMAHVGATHARIDIFTERYF